MRFSSRALLGPLLLLLALLVTGCGQEYLQNTLDPKSDFASGIHALYITVFWWTMGILVVVWGVMAYILVRFRARPGDPIPEQTHGNTTLEIVWTLIPAVIVVLIAVPTIRGVWETQRPLSDDALVVNVTGKRFFWEFEYPEFGIRTANELNLPVDRPVTLRLHSMDVIHSFWIPKLGGKRDVNPLVRVRQGETPEYNYLYFTPNEEGVYWGQCAEFCGDSHSLMGMRAVVRSQGDFDQWVADMNTASPTAIAQVPDTVDGVAQPVPAEDPQIALGRNIFLTQSVCVACHGVSGTNAVGVIGPSLTRVGGRTSIAAGLLENTPENLYRWIRTPQDVKPGSLMPGQGTAGGGFPAHGLTDDQIRAVAAYLSSLQ